ncbi:MAG: MBL fold metallo-hydrolase [Thermoprotei archaeon]
MHKYGILEDAGIHLVWFDSLGAKSSCIAIETSKGYILIDPGAAAMQPSYPLDSGTKRRLRRNAVEKIRKYASRSKVIIITHYHYDHHLKLSDQDLEGDNIYEGKTLYVKNPNTYINESQWKRARIFYEELSSRYGINIELFLTRPLQRKFRDPVETLKYIHMRDYGNYEKRRQELLVKGRQWFRKLVNLWSSNPWIKDNITINNTRILWGEGRTFTLNGVNVKICNPWFHGIEYDRTGWVLPVFIQSRGYRVVYTSDLMGPIIEDYAYHIIDYNPDIIILDGPPTYLFPYMFNKVNLERAIDNAIKLIDNKPEAIIYDHHLLRDPLWRKRVKKVLEYAKKNNVLLLTAAEVLGKKPLIDTLTNKTRQ